MAYLIVWEFPKYPDTTEGAQVVISKRHHARTMLAYEDVRLALEQKYPNHEISSPLGFLPEGLVLGVYLSPNKQGEGRIAGNFQLWAVKRKPVDFYVRNEGTIFLLSPNTPAAYAWVEEHIPDDAQHFGASVVVEHRYISDIVEGIKSDGLTVE